MLKPFVNRNWSRIRIPHGKWGLTVNRRSNESCIGYCSVFPTAQRWSRCCWSVARTWSDRQIASVRWQWHICACMSVYGQVLVNLRLLINSNLQYEKCNFFMSHVCALNWIKPTFNPLVVLICWYRRTMSISWEQHILFISNLKNILKQWVLLFGLEMMIS